MANDYRLQRSKPLRLCDDALLAYDSRVPDKREIKEGTAQK